MASNNYPALMGNRGYAQSGLVICYGFHGRILSRLRYRICRDGTLVTTGEARFNDISRNVQLSAILRVGISQEAQMLWTVISSQEWSIWEVAFSPDTIRARSILSDEEEDCVMQKPWTDGGR
eukprot:7841069-Pyramimonas_sp.AAC.1